MPPPSAPWRQHKVLSILNRSDSSGVRARPDCDVGMARGRPNDYLAAARGRLSLKGLRGPRAKASSSMTPREITSA
jgi:hypothetical protein